MIVQLVKVSLFNSSLPENHLGENSFLKISGEVEESLSWKAGTFSIKGLLPKDSDQSYLRQTSNLWISRIQRMQCSTIITSEIRVYCSKSWEPGKSFNNLFLDELYPTLECHFWGDLSLGIYAIKMVFMMTKAILIIFSVEVHVVKLYNLAVCSNLKINFL